MHVTSLKWPPPLITFDDFRYPPPCLYFPSKFEWSRPLNPAKVFIDQDSLEYTLWIQDSSYWIRDSLSVELEFQIPCAEYSGFHRKDFQGSWFYKQKLPRFQNPAYLTCYKSSLSHPSFDCDDEMLLFLIKSKFKRIRSNFFIIWIQNTALKCCSI